MVNFNIDQNNLSGINARYQPETRWRTRLVNFYIDQKNLSGINAELMVKATIKLGKLEDLGYVSINVGKREDAERRTGNNNSIIQ